MYRRMSVVSIGLYRLYLVMNIQEMLKAKPQKCILKIKPNISLNSNSFLYSQE